MRKIIVILLIFICTLPSYAHEDFDRKIHGSLFVPKGTWSSGISFSYWEMQSDNYKLFILDKTLGEGYTFKISPSCSYFFKNNMSAGMKISYNRTFAYVDNLSLNLGEDMSFDIQAYGYLEHGIQTTGFLRTYMGLGNSKVFGFFNELSVTYGFSQGKNSTGKGNDLVGTYNEINTLQIGATPGLTAFVTNNLAVEVSIDVLGLDFQWINQTTNQVETGSFRKSSANFKINIFSVNIGLCSYF